MEAYRKCPHAIFMHPNMSAIVETTEIIKNIVSDYSDEIEFVSLDEAYIEMTNTNTSFITGIY